MTMTTEVRGAWMAPCGWIDPYSPKRVVDALFRVPDEFRRLDTLFSVPDELRRLDTLLSSAAVSLADHYGRLSRDKSWTKHCQT